MIQDFTFSFLPTLQHHMSTEERKKETRKTKEKKTRGQKEVQDHFNLIFCVTL